MQSIVNNNPKMELMNNKLIKDLQKISFSVEKIHLAKMIDSFSCDVFTTDSNGVRRYQVALEKNTRFTYLYRLIDIKERKVDSRYQL